MKRRFLVGGLFTIGVVLVLATAMGIWVYFAVHRVPVFYVKAVAAPADQQTQSADHFEKNVLELHNETHRDGRWQVAISEAEINGWLATKLPSNFPNLLPPTVNEPRVAIDGQNLLIGCRYTDTWMSTVFNLTLEPYLTEAPNQIAVRIRSARAGAFPMPLRRIIETVTDAAQKSKIELHWQQVDGDPIAIFDIRSPSKNQPQYELEALELKGGRLIITGRTLAKKNSPSRSAD